MKKALCMVLALVMTVCMFACKPVETDAAPAASEAVGTGEPQADAPAAEPDGEQAITLRAVCPQGGLSKALMGAAEAYTAETGVKLEIVTPAYQEAHEKAVMELASGSDSIDFVLIDGAIWLTEQKQFLEPLDSYIANDPTFDSSKILDAYMDIYKDDTAQYCIPFRLGAWVLIYRTDLFEAAGLTVPKTMDEFYACAQALTSGSTYGFVAPLKQTNYIVAQWCPFLYTWGGDFLTDDYKAAAFNSQAGIDSLKFFASLWENGLISPAALDYEHDGVVAALQSGNAAMAITYSPYYLSANDPAASEFAGKFAVSTIIPGLTADEPGKTELSGWGIGINKNSKNKEAAWDFIKFCARDDVQIELAVKYNNSPVANAVFSSDEYLSVFPDAEAMLNSCIGAKTRPGVAQWSSIEDVLAAELSAVFAGTKTVEQALADAEAQVNAMLK